MAIYRRASVRVGTITVVGVQTHECSSMTALQPIKQLRYDEMVTPTRLCHITHEFELR